MSGAICRECGQPYERKDEQNNGFCSARCRKNYRRKHPAEKDYQKICAFCGVPFGTNSQSEIYCSDDCRKKAEPWKYPYECICEYCGEPFMARKPDARFCSCKCAACFHADETRKPESQKKEKLDRESERICLYCGAAFRPMGTHGRISRFCGSDCRNAYRNKHNPPIARYHKSGECCGNEFDTVRKNQRFCSPSCSSAAHLAQYSKEITCAICGTKLEATSPGMKYCPSCSDSIARERKQEAHNLRRQQTGDSHNRQIKLAKVYQMAGGVCEICGLPVPTEVDYNDDWAATRDHIVPMSKDGQHSYFNCQLAHRLCNSCKRDNGEGWRIDWEQRVKDELGKWEKKLERLQQLLEEEGRQMESA